MLFKSLSIRLKFMSLLWLVAAVASITLTLVLSWRLEGGAAAINDAGSLRMQTYRLDLLLAQHASAATINQHIAQFDRTLTTLQTGDPTRPLFLPDDEQVHRDMAILQQTWQQQIKPLIQSGMLQQQTINNDQLSNFTTLIDRLTHAIEKNNSRYINWLRVFQTTLLGLVMLSSFMMVVVLYLWVIQPVKKLLDAFETVHEGRLGVQIPVHNLAEFAQLDRGFNQMSSRLQLLYSNLEQQVADKTHDLEQKNYTLEILYFFSHFLNQAQTAAEASEGFLENIMSLVPAQAGSIRLIDMKRQRLDLIAQQGLPEPLQSAEACQRLDDCLCGQTVQQEQWQPIRFMQAGNTPDSNPIGCESFGFRYLHIVKIRYNEQNLGMMTLYFTKPHDLGHTAELLDSLCQQLGSAVSNIRLAEENRRLAVMQERNLMAQGLHDSIAQTLTFLNLQVQMLESALNEGQAEQVEENLGFIKTGVQECYEDVRELLLNFRTKITRKEFAEAVETLVQRFQQQTHVATQVHWNGEGLPLSSEQQLQFIFILQESLSNIRKHAQASRVDIEFNNHLDFTMTITDNGRGFNTTILDQPPGSHVGLGIMRERARLIQARLFIESQPQHTYVQLTLPQQERIPE